MGKVVTVTFLMLVVFSFCLASPPDTPPKNIVFLGDSLTEGWGVSPEQSFPALIELKLRREKLDYSVVNAGVSGDTTAGGLRRLNWVLRAPVSVLFLALGANDGLRGFNVKQTQDNLEQIILATRQKYPEAKIILAGMLVPPSMGPEYSQAFKRVFPDVAEKMKVSLMPFLLEGVAGEPQFNQIDRIHPNEDGQKRLAENVWKILRPLL